jgi:hypothetical protein
MRLPKGIPSSEFSERFVQGMANRMAVSYCKYGAVADAYPHKVNALASLRARLQKYEETGNTEFLMDAANFAMIEFMHPAHEAAHFTPTDSEASPGRVWASGATHAGANDARGGLSIYRRDGD